MSIHLKFFILLSIITFTCHPIHLIVFLNTTFAWFPMVTDFFTVTSLIHLAPFHFATLAQLFNGLDSFFIPHWLFFLKLFNSLLPLVENCFQIPFWSCKWRFVTEGQHSMFTDRMLYVTEGQHTGWNVTDGM